MKKLLSIIILCLGCLGILEAQNIWKSVNAPGYILAVGPNGYLYSTSFEMGGLSRSMDEGLTWQHVFSNETITGGAHMTVSNQGRIYLVPELFGEVFYSDNNGDIWHTSSMFPACLVEGMYAVSNDTLMIWGTDGCSTESLHFTLDGGATWCSANLGSLGETHHIGDVIANESGDVFVSFWSNNAQNDGIYRSDYTDMVHWDWELAAFPNVSIKDLEFDPDGNVVAVASAGEFNGFQQIPGFYLAGNAAESLGVADNGVVYLCNRHGSEAVLAYSQDQGAHFIEIGEPLVGANGTLFRGHDNYLYYFSNNSHWKSFDEAGNIDTNHSTFAPQGAEWYFNLPSFMGSDVSFYHMEVLGDTVIQDHQCSIISQQFLDGVDNQYVYEENRKVYWYNSTLDAFTTLYDFDAEVGESWICEVDDCSYEIRVNSIEDIFYDGRTYKVQNVAPVDGEYFYYYEGHIIDGIGSIEGLFPYPDACSGIVYDGPYPDFLRCYLVGGEMLYHEGVYACDAVYPWNTTCWDGTIAESYEGGEGTEDDPYQIATPPQLALLAQQINDGIGCTAHYALVDDICLNDEDGTLEWPVIGVDASPTHPTYFRGVFDGNGHVIEGMYIAEYHTISGLFGDAKNAVIKNLTVTGSRIVAGNGMGIIAGEARNTDFFNCNVTNCEMITTASSGGQGGILGNAIAVDAETDTLFIKDCTSDVRFSSNGYSCGGIVGYACAEKCVLVIENCVNYSNVLGVEHLGGIWGSGGVIGNDESSAFIVRECKNYGDVNLGQYGGGIAGYCWDTEVYRCFNRGDVTANYNAGGIIGINMDGMVMECANMGNVKSVSTSGSMVGGIVADHSGGVVANSYNRGAVSAIYGDAGRAVTTIGGIVGRSTGSIYNVYNAGAITIPEMPFNTRCGAILGQGDVSDHYLNCYWLEQDSLHACGNMELPGSSSFIPTSYFFEWELNEPQYGHYDLLEVLNFGAEVVLDSVPGYPYLATWEADLANINQGFPLLSSEPELPDTIQSGDLLYSIISVNPPCVSVIGHVDGEDAQGFLFIPEMVTYEGVAYTVTEIGNLAFRFCSGLEGVLEIPETVKIIGEQAFYKCSGFTRLVLPEGLLEIHEFAFGDCTGLTGTLDFPSTVTHIKFDAFANCTGFSGDLILPNSVVEVGNTNYPPYMNMPESVATFADCFDHLVLSQALDTIGYRCFAGCSRLTGDLVMPEGLKTIEGYAFAGCSGLTSLTLNDSLDYIGPYAFAECTGITGILSIPEAINVGSWAFADCTSIEGLVLPHDFTAVSYEMQDIGYVFDGCSGLTELTIPEGWTTIVKSEFSRCGNLTHVSLPESLTKIETNAFKECTNLEGINLPEGVTEIGSGAFMECRSLTQIELPTSLRTLGNQTFARCTSLAGDMVIPDLVQRIELKTFDSCYMLQSVVFGDSINYIVELAFENTNLSSLVLKAMTPPELRRMTTPNAWHFPADIPIIVPCGALEAYQDSEDWADFTNITEDCGSGLIEFQGSEWYYEIQNENGSITYQHLEYVADTTIDHKDVKIIIRTNTLYDKGEHSEVTREYVYREDQLVYWWNKDLQEFTVLYDLGAQEGDSWVIKVGTETLTMHVDAVGYNYYGEQLFKMLYVSDDQDLFSGTIVSGVGHLSSFFPERLMTRGRGYGVNGLRCYWRFGNLLFTVNRGDCDAIYAELHIGLDEPTAIPFAIYPNPTNSVLTIQHSSFNIPNSSFRITNLMGQTVQTGSLNAETQQIDVSGLPQGMYFISVGEGTRKFVVR